MLGGAIALLANHDCALTEAELVTARDRALFDLLIVHVAVIGAAEVLDDPAAIGPGMAIALLTTLYGSILANIFLDPIAAKLKTYSGQEILAKQMIIEGIMSIQSGDNPRIVEHKLSVFLSPSMRPAGEEDAGGE